MTTTASTQLTRLRALADSGLGRLTRATKAARSHLAAQVSAPDGASPEQITASAQRLALCDAEERGYRAAMAALLGALEVGE